jgi:hypothetical protein
MGLVAVAGSVLFFARVGLAVGAALLRGSPGARAQALGRTRPVS